jgi:hypothetical protein
MLRVVCDAILFGVKNSPCTVYSQDEEIKLPPKMAVTIHQSRSHNIPEDFKFPGRN